MFLGRKSNGLLCTLITGSVLVVGGCSSSAISGGGGNSHKGGDKSTESCNNLSLATSEKNINALYLDAFPKALNKASTSTSTTTSTDTPTSNKITPTDSPTNNDVSTVGAGKRTPTGKASESYTTDARGIIKDKHGIIVGIKTEATTFGVGVTGDATKFKKDAISTIGLNPPKALKLPSFNVGSQNVFDPELTTGYGGVPYINKNSLSLTPQDEKNIAYYDKVIANSINSNDVYNISTCKVNVVKAVVNSGDHGARVHISPSFSAASYGVAANYSTVEGYYVNSGWFRIISGPLKHGYINGALINSKKLKNGEIPSSQLVRIPDYLRHDVKSTASEYLNPIAARQLIFMNAAYRKVFHTNLKLNEGYRSLATQKEYWRILPSGVAAKPGASNHGFALAMDINGVVFQNTQDRWLSVYSQMFGWDRPDYFDRYGSERWHYNFIG